MYLKQVLFIQSFCYVLQLSRTNKVLDVFKLDTVSNILKLVKDLDNEPVVRLNNIQNQDGVKPETQFSLPKLSRDKYEIGNLNRVLIKRIVPHGLKYNNMDSEGVFYRPLARIHKKKRAYENNIENKNLDGNLYKIFTLKNRKPLYKKRSKLKRNYYYDEEVNSQLLKLLRDITSVVRLIHNKDTRYRAYKKVVKFLKSIDVLRTKIVEKSDEDVTLGLHVVEDKPAKAEKLPHYPPWNYWTYKKTIHQDQCPDGQVKIGNMCIWTPPH